MTFRRDESCGDLSPSHHLNALEDKDLIFEHSRRRRMTSPIGFTKDGEAEAKRLLEILSKSLE